ncbi:MAG: hypothetical protein EBR46_09755, partial [Betaproteobacteria bacterium]|nr:hypothetical protein [Betaproteobacteria bacterium]
MTPPSDPHTVLNKTGTAPSVALHHRMQPARVRTNTVHEGGDRSAWAHAQRLLDRADVRINGDRPWDLQVHHPQTFTRVLAQGSLGLGDSYVEGWWDCAQLDGFFTRILKAGLDAEVGWKARAWPWLRARLCNLQSRWRAGEVARVHYDLDPEMFERMLGPSMAYSCGYWARAQQLDDAQHDKLDLVCRKLGLGPGMTLLDIGCGDGVVGTLLPADWRYRGIDLSNAAIYEQNASDERILYSSPDQLEAVLAGSEPADAVLMLDVLEHTRRFCDLFERAIPLARRYLIVSLPNELFLLDRLRLLAGKEHPAHSLDLIHLPEGFKHQYLINISKARQILADVASRHGFALTEEWQRPLLAKNKLVQPGLWLLRQLSSAQLWSMGSVFVFER